MRTSTSKSARRGSFDVATPRRNRFGLEILTYTVGDDFTFAPGSATPQPSAASAVDELVALNRRLQYLLGHDRITTTEIYMNISPEDAIPEFQAKW